MLPKQTENFANQGNYPLSVCLHNELIKLNQADNPTKVGFFEAIGVFIIHLSNYCKILNSKADKAQILCGLNKKNRTSAKRLHVRQL